MDAMRTEKVARHYAPAQLYARIAEGLRASGLDPELLQPSDLDLVDQFHTRGRPATMQLAYLAGLRPGMRVIDLGGGLGGPARALASERGCDVTVIDLSDEFCRAGELLTRATGLSGQVRFRVGDATEVPMHDGSFDVAWTQHSTMNIDDKAALYREARRLVQPGGLLAIHEVAAGPVQPIHFPVPWASVPDISFLVPPAHMRELIAAAGFEEIVWRDVSAESLAWYRERASAATPGQPPLGLHLLLGESFAECFRNLVANAEQSRTAIVQGLFRRA